MQRDVKIILYIMVGLVAVCSFVAIQQHGITKFCELNLSDVLGLLITGIVFFNLTNIIDSRSKKSEVFVELLEKLQENLQDERLCCIKTQADVEFVRLRIRKISNNINCIKKMKMKKVQGQVDYIVNKFQSYEDKFCNHITDIDYLSKSETDFKNDLDLIDNKCDEMIVELYL